MNDMALRLGVPIALERISTPFTPFTWAPIRPTRIRVALAGAGACRASTTSALRASGHSVTAYATAGALVYQLRGQPRPFDAIVLDCGEDTGAVVPALELLQDQSSAPPIVLIADDDPNVREAARRFSVERVLERPVQPAMLLAALAALWLPRWDEVGAQGDVWRL